MRSKPASFDNILPEFIINTLKHQIPNMLKQLNGVNLEDAILYAAETRSSSPVRIVRNESGESVNIKGLYPIGEGAGYAGGIVSSAVDGLKIACTPARHFAGRYIFDSDYTLWSSFVLKDEYNTIFDSGDTGYGDHFEEISRRYGEISLALLDGAQYNEKWHDVHMFPEESVMASLKMDAKVSMLVHHSAFTLSNHAWDDPLERFTRYAKENSVEYMQPKLGETVNLKDYKNYQENWWKDVE